VRGDFWQMGGKFSKEYKLQSDFGEIVKRAYEKGISDGTITVEKLLEDIKSDLLKMKISS
jgi:hypothetical protein